MGKELDVNVRRQQDKNVSMKMGGENSAFTKVVSGFHKMKPSLDMYSGTADHDTSASHERDNIKSYENCCQEIIDIFNICRDNVTVQKMNKFKQACLLKQQQDVNSKCIEDLCSKKQRECNNRGHGRSRPPNPVAQRCLMKQPHEVKFKTDIFKDNSYEKRGVQNFKPISSALETGMFQTGGESYQNAPLDRKLLAENDVFNTKLLNNCNNHVTDFFPEEKFRLNHVKQYGLLQESHRSNYNNFKNHITSGDACNALVPPPKLRQMSLKSRVNADSKLDSVKDAYEEMFRGRNIEQSSQVLSKMCNNVLVNQAQESVDHNLHLKGMKKRASKLLGHIFEDSKQNTAIACAECARTEHIYNGMCTAF